MLPLSAGLLRGLPVGSDLAVKGGKAVTESRDSLPATHQASFEHRHGGLRVLEWVNPRDRGWNPFNVVIIAGRRLEIVEACAPGQHFNCEPTAPDRIEELRHKGEELQLLHSLPEGNQPSP